uniref:Immunoglobulin V-set domain-containing protein n=1 Tax=Salarias fasciatus TaxID=181472 RepID=A0A672HFZ5_SALFA
MLHKKAEKIQSCSLTLRFLCLCFPADIICEDLKPIKNEELSLSGSNVSLVYEYQKLSSGDYFFWYRQYPGKPPQFLISHSAKGSVINNPVPGLEIKVTEKQIHLIISSAAVSDSAVYYCAVRPTVTGNTQPLYKNLTAAH